MLSLSPIGISLDLHTESEWLASDLEGLTGHADSGFSGGLSWDEVPIQWKRVLEYTVEEPQSRRLMISLKQEQIPSYQDIMSLYLDEMIEKAEGCRLDATPDEAPWS
jgi:hypothetical protein